MSVTNILLLGLITGWLIEWIIDWYLWRRENEILTNQLATFQVEADRLKAELQETRAQLKQALFEKTDTFKFNDDLTSEYIRTNGIPNGFQQTNLLKTEQYNRVDQKH